jgi:parallel beta-helix repeat protein
MLAAVGLLAAACGGTSSSPPPSSPPPAQTQATGAVAIAASANAQAVVGAYAPGTTFTIAAGTHANWTMDPKAGDTFVGQAGAVLNGENKTAQAFTSGGNPSAVTIEGASTTSRMLVENYTDNHTEEATVDAGRGGATTGWKVENLEVANNVAEGIGLGGNKEVAEGNYVHDNGQLGMGGPGVGIVVEDNIVDHNGYHLVVGAGVESGGIKIEAGGHNNRGPFTEANATALVEGNTIEDNASGPGFHTDCGADGVWLVGNTISDNQQKGVLWEISEYDTATGNTITGNKDPGLLVSASWYITATDNTIANNGGAVELNEFTRSQTAKTNPSCWTPNTGTNHFTASGNTTTSSGPTGGGLASTVASFTADKYVGASAFNWGNRNLTYAQWLKIFPGD